MATKTLIQCASRECINWERVRYFPRQLITAEDMIQEQEYFLNKLRRHNRLLHGWGVVCGLCVDRAIDKECEFIPWTVVIKPGYALAICGTEIIVDQEVVVDLRKETLDDGGSGPCRNYTGTDSWCSEVEVARDPGQPLYVAIKYRECYSRPVRVQPSGCSCDETRCEYSRIRDSFAVKVLTEIPDYGDWDKTTCPPCPESPWLILAKVRCNADGAVIEISHDSPPRRKVESHAFDAATCPDVVTTIHLPPEVVSTEPEDLAFVNTLSQVRAVLEDHSGEGLDLDLSTIRLVSPGGNVVIGTQAGSGNDTIVLTLSSPLPTDGSDDGTYIIEVRAVDNEGNTADDDSSFLYDTLPPVATTTPEEGDLEVPPSQILVELSDTVSGIRDGEVVTKLTDPDGNEAVATVSVSGDVTVPLQIPAPSLPDEYIYDVAVTLTDKAGNEGSYSFSFSWWGHDVYDVVETVTAVMDTWAAGDTAGAAMHLADDVTLLVPSSDEPLAGDEAKGYFARAHEAFSDASLTMTDEALGADNTAVVRYELAGTHTGEWTDVPPTGNNVRLLHMAVSDFGSKIKKMTIYGDDTARLMLPSIKLPLLGPSPGPPSAEPTGLPPLEASAEFLNRWNKTQDISEVAKMISPKAKIMITVFGQEIDRKILLRLQKPEFLNIQVKPERSMDMGKGWVLLEGDLKVSILGVGPSIQTRVGVLQRFNSDGLMTNMFVYLDSMALLKNLGWTGSKKDK